MLGSKKRAGGVAPQRRLVTTYASTDKRIRRGDGKVERIAALPDPQFVRINAVPVRIFIGFQQEHNRRGARAGIRVLAIAGCVRAILAIGAGAGIGAPCFAVPPTFRVGGKAELLDQRVGVQRGKTF